MPFNPFSILTSKIFAGTSLFLLLLAGGFWIGWGNAADARDKLRQEAGTIVVALKEASDNQDVTWETAPGQIIALGESNKRLKGAIAEQNATIDQMAADAVRLKAKAADLKKIADRAQAQRQAALTRLSDMAITPGTRSDCMVLLREAEDALDTVRKAGG